MFIHYTKPWNLGGLQSVYDKWFFRDKDEYKNLKEKIDREYKRLGKYYAFAPPHSLTCFDLYEITINCMIK